MKGKNKDLRIFRETKNIFISNKKIFVRIIREKGTNEVYEYF